MDVIASSALALGLIMGPIGPDAFYLGEVVTAREEAAVWACATGEVGKRTIQLTDAKDVSDAINSLPGVSLSIGRRNEKAFNLRGFEQKQVPILYDGIPIYVPYDGYVDAGKIPAGNLSKITLTKGICSSLYGPSTIGGVVNIITRKPRKRFEGDLKAGLSEKSTKDVSVNLGSRLERFYLALGAGYTDSDGFAMSRRFDGAKNENGGMRDNSDVLQRSGSFKIGFLPAKGHEYAFGTNVIDGEWGLPPHVYDQKPKYWRFTDWKKETYYLLGDSRMTDDLSVKTRIFYDKYFNVLDSYDDDAFSSRTKNYAFHSTYDDHSKGASAELRTSHVRDNVIAFAFSYKTDVHKEQDDRGSAWERYEADTCSLALEDDIDLGNGLSLVAGASYDNQNPKYANGSPLRDNESALNLRARMNLGVFEDSTLHLSAGRMTRFPSLKELYSGYLDKNIPNPGLKEERAVNCEIGMEKLLESLSTIFVFNVFRSDIKDLIVNRPVGGNKEQLQNAGKACYSGAEFAVKSAFLKNNEFDINYTYLRARDRSPNRTSDYLPDRQEHKLYASDSWRLDRCLSLFAKMEWYSKRHYQDPATVQWGALGGYWTADAKAMCKVTDNVLAEAGVRNMFDTNYETSYGYPREGRVFFGGMKVTF